MSQLQHQTAWITGASDGIGKELAVQLAKEGMKIVLTARSKDKLEQVAQSLAGEGHLVFPMDLLKTEAISDSVQEVLAKMQKVDLLINNAGVSQRSLAQNTSLDVDRKIMELNHFAVVALTKALIPHWLERQSGHIVTISSVAGKIGTPKRSAYCAAKHAVIGFMDSLRAELYPHNIKVMVVTPGSVRTNISKNALEGDGSKHGTTDPAIANGIAVEECVHSIITGIKNNTSELLIAKGKEKLAAYLKRFFPGLVFKMVRSMPTT